MAAKFKLTSIENASLIRKFTILFIVMSLLPFSVVAYFFLLFKNEGSIDFEEGNFVILLLMMGAGLLVGFLGMRRSILKIQKIARDTAESLRKNIGTTVAIGGEESEITQLSRTFKDVTSNLENTIKRLQDSKQTMQYVLSRLASGLASLENIDTFLELIVEVTTNALDAKTGVLMLLDEEKQELYIKSASGLDNRQRGLRIAVGQEGPGWVAKHKKPLLIPTLHSVNIADTEDPFSPPLLCAPMLCQDKLIGVLSVAGKLRGGNFEEDELLIISNLASQTAVAVENNRLHLDAEKTYLETISALALAVEARDHYSRGHLDRVAQLSVKVARKLGLDEQAVKDIQDAAELHDVGKIGIGDSILKKAGELTAEEKEVIHKHPVIGEGIIKPVRSLSRLCPIIRHHHEFLDGTGYPDGLKGDQIPIGAKILSVVDSFDAMTIDRPYSKALSIEAAKEELKRYIDIRYDRKVVEAFLNIIK